jgi:acyl carrier protein
MNEIKQVIASTFQIPIESISSESSSQDIPQWDSVGHINLVMGLEKQFGVKFNMNEILEMRDVSTIERILQEKR